MKKLLILLPIIFLSACSVKTSDFNLGEPVSALPPVKQSGQYIVPRQVGSIIGSSTVSIYSNVSTSSAFCFTDGSGCLGANPPLGNYLALSSWYGTTSKLNLNVNSALSLTSDPTDCLIAGTAATAIDVYGNLTCTAFATSIAQLGQIGDVSTTTLNNGYVLKWNGSIWESVATSTLGFIPGTGTITSVDMTVPTGLSISGNPITSAGTLALTLTGGYEIPKTASTSDWNTAYSWGNHAGLYDVIGQATGTITIHNSIYNHANFITGINQLGQIGDVSTSTLSYGHVPMWNGSTWQDTATSSLGLTAIIQPTGYINAGQVSYWASGYHLAGEDYLSTSRGGLGYSMNTGGPGSLVYSINSTEYRPLSAGNVGEVLVANGARAPVWTATSSLGISSGGGTVTSVDMTVPTGLTISGNPITTSGTLALSLTGGYEIPKTASTSNWNSTYNIVNANSTNWDTAYSWGNHAGLYDVLGQATGTMAIHNSAYNHANFLTSSPWGATTSGSIWYNGGNVGIGTSSPTYKFEVNGNAYITGTTTASDFYIPSMDGNTTYKTVNDFFKLWTSAGRFTGGEMTSVDGTHASVAAGTGLMRMADDDISQVKFIDWIASSSVSVAEGETKYIGIEYNSGSPRVAIHNSWDWNLDTEFPLGRIINDDSTALHIISNPWWVGDGMTNVLELSRSFGRIRKDENVGGLSLSVTGTRNVAVTGGTLWSNLNEFPIAAINTASTGTVEYYWYNGVAGTWSDSDVTQYSVTQWNDTTAATLQTISNNKFCNIWVYAEADDLDITLIYPQAQYNTAAEAEATLAPSLLPSHVQQNGILIGRIIIKQGVNTPVSVQTYSIGGYSASVATAHNNLTNLDYASSGHTGFAGTDVANTFTALNTFVNASTSLLSVSGDSWFNTIKSGAWNGTAITAQYGGTGSTTLSGLLLGNGTGVVQSVVNNSANWNTAYGWGDHAGLYDVLGQATGSIAIHNNAYNHASFITGIPQLGMIGDVSTSTLAYGHLLMWNGSDWQDTATSSLGITGTGGGVTSVDMSVPTGLTISGNPITTAGTLALTLAGGYEITKTASSSNWNSFYDTPSTRITAGDYIDWSGNTLNVTDSWYNAISDISLTEGYVIRGSASNTGIATSALYIASTSKIGIGNVFPYAPLHVGNRTPVSYDPQIIISRYLTDTPAMNGHAFVDESSINRNFASFGYNSYDARSEITGSYNYDHIASFQARQIYNSSGTITDMESFVSIPVVGNGTLTNSYSFHAYDVSKSGGTITNNYGLYVHPLTAGTNNWAIYTEGGTNSYFGGGITVTTATATNAIITTNLTIPNGSAMFTNSAGKAVVDLTSNQFRFFGTATTTLVGDQKWKFLISSSTLGGYGSSETATTTFYFPSDERPLTLSRVMAYTDTGTSTFRFSCDGTNWTSLYIPGSGGNSPINSTSITNGSCGSLAKPRIQYKHAFSGTPNQTAITIKYTYDPD